MCAVGFGGRHTRSLFNKGAAYNLSLHLSWPINSYSSISSTLVYYASDARTEENADEWLAAGG